jgi:hypothetical protein
MAPHPTIMQAVEPRDYRVTVGDVVTKTLPRIIVYEL